MGRVSNVRVNEWWSPGRERWSRLIVPEGGRRSRGEIGRMQAAAGRWRGQDSDSRGSQWRAHGRR